MDRAGFVSLRAAERQQRTPWRTAVIPQHKQKPDNSSRYVANSVNGWAAMFLLLRLLYTPSSNTYRHLAIKAADRFQPVQCEFESHRGHTIASQR